MPDKGTYQREDLEKILTSCIAMSALDGEITEDELRPVVTFVERNWLDHYGNINGLVVTARDRAGEILGSHSLKESLTEMARSLSGSLDDIQKKSVLALLINVLHADEEGHEFEHGMYEIFETHF